jgi:hypothetical protein
MKGFKKIQEISIDAFRDAYELGRSDQLKEARAWFGYCDAIKKEMAKHKRRPPNSSEIEKAMREPTPEELEASADLFINMPDHLIDAKVMPIETQESLNAQHKESRRFQMVKAKHLKS